MDGGESALCSVSSDSGSKLCFHCVFDSNIDRSGHWWAFGFINWNKIIYTCWQTWHFGNALGWNRLWNISKNNTMICKDFTTCIHWIHYKDNIFIVQTDKLCFQIHSLNSMDPHLDPHASKKYLIIYTLVYIYKSLFLMSQKNMSVLFDIIYSLFD